MAINENSKIDYEFLINNNYFRQLTSKEEIISAYFLYGYSFFSMARSLASDNFTFNGQNCLDSINYLKLIADKKSLSAFDLCQLVCKDKKYIKLKPLFTDLYKISQKPYLRAGIGYAKQWGDINYKLYVCFNYNPPFKNQGLSYKNEWFSNFRFVKSSVSSGEKLIFTEVLKFPIINDRYNFIFISQVENLNLLNLG